MLGQVRKLKVEQIVFLDSENEPSYCRACYQIELRKNEKLQAEQALRKAGE